MMISTNQVPDEEKGEQKESSSEESSDESEGEDEEETPLLKFQKKPNQFLKALSAFWPFGEAFKELSIFNKIIEIVKVSKVSPSLSHFRSLALSFQSSRSILYISHSCNSASTVSR